MLWVDSRALAALRWPGWTAARAAQQLGPAAAAQRQAVAALRVTARRMTVLRAGSATDDGATDDGATGDGATGGATGRRARSGGFGAGRSASVAAGGGFGRTHGSDLRWSGRLGSRKARDAVGGLIPSVRVCGNGLPAAGRSRRNQRRGSGRHGFPGRRCKRIVQHASRGRPGIALLSGEIARRRAGQSIQPIQILLIA